MLAVLCSACGRKLKAWPVERCDFCGADPHAQAPPDDTAEWEVPPELRQPPPGWEDPDVVEE